MDGKIQKNRQTYFATFAMAICLVLIVLSSNRFAFDAIIVVFKIGVTSNFIFDTSKRFNCQVWTTLSSQISEKLRRECAVAKKNNIQKGKYK